MIAPRAVRDLLAVLLVGVLVASQKGVLAEEPAASSRSQGSLNKNWLTWGPYRPGHYFGVRPNIPQSLMIGLFWGNGTTKDSLIATLRDTCAPDDDGIESYGWTLYDPRVGGSQTIRDKTVGIDLETNFIKHSDGSGWAVRVSGDVRPDVTEDIVSTTLTFHFSMEGAEGWSEKELLCDRSEGVTGHIDGVACRGKDPALGPFDLRLNADPLDQSIKRSALKSKTTAEEKIWQAKTTFLGRMYNFGGDESGSGNVHYFRYEFKGPFSATLSYRDESRPHLSPAVIATTLEDLGPSFSTQMNKVFPRTAPFRDPRHAAFSQALLSNLLAGLGFFHGDSESFVATKDDDVDIAALIASKNAMPDTKVTSNRLTSLLSFTPSRSSFPRGVLWDEGFHLLPVIEWDIDLAITVLKSWLTQMSEDGWIAREQIIGPEVRSSVPEESQVQHPHHVNPPTLLVLVLPALLSKLTNQTPYYGHQSRYMSAPEKRTSLLKALYTPLSRYYAHFRSTQAGTFNSTLPRPSTAISGEGYRWRGRTAEQHTPTSGLDDYPRADPPSTAELHVDALAWVAASAKALLALAEHLSRADDAAMYRKHLGDALHNLDALHWSDSEGAYCDATLSGDGAEYVHVCHVGYVSLMPLLLGLMNTAHAHLPALLDTLADPKKLWSPHGLRSLSAKDELYGSGENHWRGAVWMNLNALAVLRLGDIGREGYDVTSARARGLAEALRVQVVDTVHGSWLKTGTVWEQYGDVDGEGRRGKAFTGWTATLLLLMGLDFSPESLSVEVVSSEFVEPDTVLDDGAAIMDGPERRMSIQTVTAWVLVTLVLILLRRRVLRLTGRVTGALGARAGG